MLIRLATWHRVVPGQVEAKGRFQIDSVIPVSGKSALIGTADEGQTLRDVATDINSLRSRVKYL